MRGEMLRIILHVHACQDLDLVPIAPGQGAERLDVARELLRRHTKWLRERDVIGGVVRKAQHFQAAADSIFDVFFLAALSVVAAVSVGMVVSDHCCFAPVLFSCFPYSIIKPRKSTPNERSE